MKNENLASIIEGLKEAISIEELISEDGIELKEQGSELVGFHSNMHGSVSKKSLKVNRDEGIYYCFNCGEGGDIITWLRENRGYSFLEAVMSLGKKANIAIGDEIIYSAEEVSKKMVAQSKIQNFYAKAAEAYHNQLGEDEYRFLYENWGLEKDTIKKYKIGYAPVGGKFIMERMVSEDCHENIIRASGMVNKNDFDLFQGRIVFPYWKHNKIVYFIGRQTDKTPKYEWEKAKYKKLLTNSDSNPHVHEVVKNDHFVGENSMWGEDEAIITEGVTDCYAALQHGFACISPATIMFKQDDYQRLFKLTKNLKTVYICNDNEVSDAGLSGAKKTAEYLESNGVSVRIVELPLIGAKEKIDLAEFLRDNGKDSFLQLMKEAKTLLEIDFDLLSQDINNNDQLNILLKRVAALDSEVERESWIKKIKSITNIGVTAIRNDIKKISKELKENPEAECEAEEKNLADQLIKITKEKVQLFHDEIGSGFARINIEGHFETWPLNGEKFRSWLIKQYYDMTGKSPNSDAVRQAINTINAISTNDGEMHDLSLRVGKYKGMFWYDLANNKWENVKITKYGWLVSDRTPILFQRHANTAPQVTPIENDNYNLDLLDKYFNLQNTEDYVLMYACVASFLIPEIPHPTIIFYGDKGSAKSTAQRVIRKIVDPAVIEAVYFPKDRGELGLQLMKNYVSCFDNLDNLKNYQSDLLCQAVTGGGTSKRKLFSDSDEVIIKFKRCIMLNGINLVATRDDLLDRSVIIRLDRISKDNRKEESEFWEEFEEDRPYILGSLFNIVSKAMAIYPTVKLDNLPRMADFARWGYALTEAMGKSGKEFLEIYYNNIAKANEEAVQENMVSAAVVDLLEVEPFWSGTATELLLELSGLDSVHETDKKWPKKPHTLSKELNLMSSALADQGIEIKRYREGKDKIIELSLKT